MMTARYRSQATEMPAVSTAAGFSPTARSRSPKRVRNSTHQENGDHEEGDIDQHGMAGDQLE
jgi:hypothetical protein